MLIFLNTLLFIAPVFILYITSRILTSMILEFFAHGFQNRKLAVWLYSLLFLPGIILHEASHVFVALALFVRVGDISFFPRLEKIDNKEEIQLGYAQIAQSDVFRASAIGVAPLLLGFLLLGFGSRYVFGEFVSWKSILNTVLSWRGIVAVYGGLSISQLMWTSKSDRQEWFTALVLLISVGICIYFLFGLPTISFTLPSVLSRWMITLFTSTIHGAWFVAGINTVMIVVISLLFRKRSYR